LGAGKHLINFVKKFYQRKNITLITLAACPAKLTAEDLKLTRRQRMDRLVAYYESLEFQQDGKKSDASTEMVCYLPGHAQGAQPVPAEQPKSGEHAQPNIATF
jgi:hypothetical protein